MLKVVVSSQIQRRPFRWSEGSEITLQEQLHLLPLRRLVLYHFLLSHDELVVIVLIQAVPVVDGNVVRVITRLKAISANPKDSKTVKDIW